MNFQDDLPENLDEECHQEGKKTMNFHTHVRKDNSVAEKCREEGNKKFKTSEFYDALQFYNKSLCFAESGSEGIALTYGNRSAVYLEIKEFDQCLENIQLARDAGFPKDKLDRLDTRERRCKQLKERRNEPSEDENPWNFFKLSYPPNKNYPAIANCLELRSDDQYGRYIITNQDLSPGDIIAIEENPFKTLKRESCFIRCANCFKSNKISLVPSTNCASAMFCSQKCLDSATDKYMCAVDEVSIVPRTTLAALDIVGGDFKELELLMTDPEKRSKTVFDLDLSDPNDPNFKYNQLLALNSQFEFPVEFSKYYKSHPILKRWPNEREKEIVANFMIHLERRRMNAMEQYINQFWNKEDDGEIRAKSDMNQHINLGSSFLLFASLCSHSCCQNIHRTNVDGKSVFYVSLPIKKGEQVYFNYGVSYHEPLKERQKYLMDMFGFQCSCVACENDWTWATMPVVDPEFKFAKLKFTSIKAAKEEFKHNCDYIEENFNNFPCREIISCEIKNRLLLNIIAKNEKFQFDNIN